MEKAYLCGEGTPRMSSDELEASAPIQLRACPVPKPLPPHPPLGCRSEDSPPIRSLTSKGLTTTATNMAPDRESLQKEDDIPVVSGREGS